MFVVVCILFVTSMVVLVFTVRMDFMGMFMSNRTVHMGMDMLLVMLVGMLIVVMFMSMFRFCMLIWRVGVKIVSVVVNIPAGFMSP